jgi:hypothetical protein
MVAAGQDASVFDPTARMMVSAAGFRALAERVAHLADELADGRLVKRRGVGVVGSSFQWRRPPSRGKRSGDRGRNCVGVEPHGGRHRVPYLLNVLANRGSVIDRRL